ncbi:MAG: response regulator transcription factor [Nannocystaceae bacterium]|nr:response regulator transcription factor [bacterium]
MRILVVEDNEPLLRSLDNGLREAGFAVDTCRDGQSALRTASAQAYDALILDLMLPELDGMTVLRTLRAQGCQTHVLILTARDQLDERIAGLDAGADDYLVKPFAFRELLARVRALVRREYGTKGRVLRVDDLEVDTVTRRVTRGGQQLSLTAREYALLEYLVVRRGAVVTRAELHDHLYDFVSEPISNVVNVHVSALRKKLREAGGRPLLHTRRGQGYTLDVQP